MKPKTRGSLIAYGGLLAILGSVAAVVYFFQPWRTCSYEDTSVGCAMLPADATGMVIAFCIAAIGGLVFIIGITARASVEPSVR
ncbi:hypothetical protein [Microbacterium paludicola]|uniref:hypothetical protein n=1 Tax=Microbacterium paludicola TaxID=300019 RepID=UPI0031E1001A